MRFRILGPLSVEIAGAPLRIRSARVSALLATLLLEANRTVPTERLIEAVWGWHAPATARSQLTIVVSQLRRLLARTGVPRPVVFTESAGYRLAATADELDVLLFERYVADADRAASTGRPVDAVGRYRSALDLWRGPVLAGVQGQLVSTAGTLLTERRAAVRARCIDLELALGRHADLVTELVGLAAADPFNERFRENLVLALYRCGRVTEALAAYQDYRQRLADEVGIEPGPRLAALHRQILNRDPVLDPPTTQPTPTRADVVPTRADMAPTRADAVPTRTDAMPTHADAMPTHADVVPAHADVVPTQPEAVPEELSAVPAGGGGTESNRPGRRPGGPPARRRIAGRPTRRSGGTPRRPAGQPGGPARRRPSGRDGTAGQPSEHCGEPPAPLPAGDGQAGDGLPGRPWQLPSAVADFVGRELELARIRAALGGDSGRAGPALVVVAGMPGVGKTALAIRAGWDVGPDHPDGCLYAELVDDRGSPVDPYEVLGGFLRALGVPEGSVPVGRSERRDLYRSVVAQRRLLVLLDGAVDESQVRPLLPTGPASATLVTARHPLTGLDGAHLLPLDVLPVEPAVRLLTAMLPDRVADDLPAAHRVVQFCDRLPSAIRVTGSRLAAGRDGSLGQAAERLADGPRRLDGLVDGSRDVRRGLTEAYRRLATGSATLLRRLGTLPVAEFPGWLAVPLLDTDQDSAEQALAELADAGLVRAVPDRRTGLPRYRMPELVRLYAQERVAVDDPPPTRGTAHRRAYWWLLDLALRADGQLPDQVFPAGALGLPEGFGPYAGILRAVDADPLGWLTAERHLVVGAAGQAAALGDTELAWRLAVAPTNFLRQRRLTGLWQRAVDHGRRALRGHGGSDRARALLSLGNALLLLSRAESAAAWTSARTARQLFDELGDRDRAAACATAQWLAEQHNAPVGSPVEERLVVPCGTDEPAASARSRTRGTLRGVIRRIGVPPRATPVLCAADQPEPPRRAAPSGTWTASGTASLATPRRTPVQRPSEVVTVLPGRFRPPDPALPRGA
ncbi:BTAD domain-containing putative transcriptional regulator [Plantactinospora sp. WMMB782]|uniref:AfsR/SARP family transcriptional regulator n=1 Tax=Plantactinospora sp. WMMB782 TaxID=3404121 RepID=UPI003B95ED7F